MPRRSLTLLVLAALLPGCAFLWRDQPFFAVEPDTPELRRGQKVFMQNCNPCHPGGQGGLGPGIVDKPLPAALIKLQVRHGLSAMPAFSEKDISDAELEDLVSYILALRQADEPKER